MRLNFLKMCGATIFIALLSIVPVRASGAQGVNERQVIVISIDGMTPAEYEDTAAHGLKIPNMSAMRAGGCASPGVIPMLPASTYPNHTSMVTGVSPALHGVISNTPIDPF